MIGLGVAYASVALLVLALAPRIARGNRAYDTARAVRRHTHTPMQPQGADATFPPNVASGTDTGQ